MNVESVRPVLVQAANRNPAVASVVQQALQAAQQGNVIARDTLADKLAGNTKSRAATNAYAGPRPSGPRYQDREG